MLSQWANSDGGREKRRESEGEERDGWMEREGHFFFHLGAMSSLTEERRAVVASSIRAIPDFPKKGILFQDVTTLLLDPKVCVRGLWWWGKQRESCRIGRRRRLGKTPRARALSLYLNLLSISLSLSLANVTGLPILHRRLCGPVPGHKPRRGGRV